MGEAESKNSVSNIGLAGIAIKSYLYVGPAHNGAIQHYLAGMTREPDAQGEQAVAIDPVTSRQIVHQDAEQQAGKA